jgi:hypothetical protein
MSMLMLIVCFWKFEDSSANTDDSGRITGKVRSRISQRKWTREPPISHHPGERRMVMVLSARRFRLRQLHLAELTSSSTMSTDKTRLAISENTE